MSIVIIDKQERFVFCYNLSSIMDILYYIFGLAIALGTLILIHELGHLLVGKWLGFRVERFSIGFGKKILRWKGPQTEYALSILPLGGYTKFSGDEPDAVAADPHDFYAKPAFLRFLVVAAGPFFNLVLAAFFFTVINSVGYNYTSVPNVVDEVREQLQISNDTTIESPAYAAGIKPGDKLIAVNGVSVTNMREFQQEVAPRAGATVDITAERNGKPEDFHVKLAVDPDTGMGLLGVIFQRPANVYLAEPDMPAAQAGLKPGDTITAVAGEPISDGNRFYAIVKDWPNGTPLPITVQHEDGTSGQLAINLLSQKDPEGNPRNELNRTGVVLGLQKYHRSYAFPQALVRGSSDSLGLVVATYRTVWMIITSQVRAEKAIGGPVMVATLAGETFREGWLTFLQFLAAMSCMLAAANFLPIPMLDGGHIVLNLWEMITRKRPSKRFLLAWQQVGIAVVVLITVFALFSDFVRIF
jgi:regulator of sigma E protease